MVNLNGKWNIALSLGDVEIYDKAEEMLQEAMSEYRVVRGEEYPQVLEYKYGMTPLGWAARNGWYAEVVRLLLVTDGVNPDSGDWYNRTPLSHASAGGYERYSKAATRNV